jgi:hypothetical protein
MLLILGRDPIKIYSVFAIFKLSLFEDNHTLTFFKSLFAISSASFNGLLLATFAWLYDPSSTAFSDYRTARNMFI